MNDWNFPAFEGWCKEQKEFAERCRKALEAQDAIPPAERFQDMVDRGVICEHGCVLNHGAWPHEDERHVFAPGDKVRMTADYKRQLAATGSHEHVEEFGACVGVIVGPADLGEGPPAWPELDVRWQPSNLRYAYHPHNLARVRTE